jgi:hypothetical protein
LLFLRICEECCGMEKNFCLRRWWIHHQWIHQHGDNVFVPPPLHFYKAEQLRQKKFNVCMLHVHDKQLAFVFFLRGKGIWEFAVKPSWIWVVFGFTRSTRWRPTEFDARRTRMRLVVVIRSCWIFAW